jgi:hypothetical protein
MPRPYSFVPCLALAVLVCTVASVHASPTSSFQANVSSSSVHVSLGLSIIQNLTSIQANMSFPEFQGTLAGTNSSNLAMLLEKALQSQVSTATVDNAVLSEQSFPWSNLTNTQYLNLSLNFDVHDVQKSQTGVYHVDMSWKSFAISSPIAIGSFEANKIGSYLLAGAKQIAELPTTQSFQNGNVIIRLTLDVYSKIEEGSNFPPSVQNLSILNFSRMAKPISTWAASFDSASNTITWSSNIGKIPLIDAFQTTIEAGNTTRTDYVMTYNLHAKVTAPGGSTVQGDSVVSTFQGANEGVMGIIIVVAVALGFGSFLYERRILVKTSKKRGRR